MDIAILPELKKRMSPLIFDERDLDKEKLPALVEAARWAPSCSNNQSWNYVFVHKKANTREALEAALTRGNEWAKKAPYLVAVAADPDQDCKDNGLPFYAYNAGLSVMCLVVEAEHLGLRAHQMAGWNEQKVRQALGYPSNFRVIVLFALGYEADVKSMWDTFDDRTKSKLARLRERKPPSENFFSERYGKTLLKPTILEHEGTGVRSQRAHLNLVQAHGVMMNAQVYSCINLRRRHKKFRWPKSFQFWFES
jgi:nitroreductase